MAEQGQQLVALDEAQKVFPIHSLVEAFLDNRVRLCVEMMPGTI